ncbi:MAG: BamA/TamA family outer membrane protein [Anaeromyxobacteraceae bacterium]
MTRPTRHLPHLLALLAGLLPAPGLAQYDPALRWRTLETPSFRVHYYEGEEALARRTAGALERSRDLLTPAFPWMPTGKTEVVLADHTDEANGMATVFPYDAIHLVATPPDSLSELNDYADWLLSLSAHEYVHVVHVNSRDGVPAAIDSIFGKILLPNGFVPPWVTEGMAVLHESGPGHGRNASALFDMYARAMVVEGGLFPLHVVSNQPLDWPLGNMWYLLGGRFLSFLHERTGPDGLKGFVAEQARWVWPFAIGVVAEDTLGGQDFRALWGEFGEALRLRYEAQLAAIGRSPVTEPRWLTHRGARVLHPRWSPDGSFVAYWDRGLDGPQGIRRVSPDGADLGLAAEIPANGTFALRSPTEAVVAVQDYYRYYWLWSDLWRVDLGTGRRTRITEGERATDPDVLPGGDAVAYVARVAPGEMALKRLSLARGEREVLFHLPGAQIYLPRISPDGLRVAFELQEGARRDIAVWEAGRVVRISNDDAIDTSPEWLPDGRLLFASDRTGVYDLYLFEPGPGGYRAAEEEARPPLLPPEPATLLSLVPPVGGAPLPATLPASPEAKVPVVPGTIRRVTNSAMGAMQPASAPDGRRLAYVSYSRAGYDLARLDLPEGPFPEAGPAAPRPAGLSYDQAPDFPSVPYDPLPMLLPRYWLPVFGWDAAGFTLGALSSASDVVGLHSWAADVRWSFGTTSPVYDASYVGQWLRTPLVLSSGRWIDSAPDLTGVYEEVWTPLRAALLVPIRELYHRLAISLGWSGTFYRALNPPEGPLPLQDGFRSMISGSVSWDTTRQFVNSISRISGIQASVAAGVTSPVIGSDYDYAWGAVAANGYVRVPGTSQWVLALHLAAGVSDGTFGGQYPFSLGGIPSPDVTALLLGALGFATAGAQPDQLRGYPSGAFQGSRLLSGTLELRFPIFAPQWGWSTWPAFLRRVSGGVFMDAGNAWVPIEGIPWWERIRFSVGAEVSVELVLGFYLPVTLRVGVGQALGRLLAPGDAPDPKGGTQVYVTLGQSF